MNRLQETKELLNYSPFETKWRGLWVLEYNQKQNNFHIQEAESSFIFNLEGYLNEETSNWVTMGVFNCYQECEEYKDLIQNSKKN